MKFRIIHHVDQATIDRMYADYAAVFILSTGRAGSKFIVRLLGHSDTISAFHEPRPTLQYFSDYAYHHQAGKETLTRMFDAARMESILEVFIKERIYVESNQCLSFFAPIIAGLFRGAKFVHLIRHPGDFVRSGVRKGWHKNDSIWESGRVSLMDKKRWAGMDQVEKLSWVWQTTNSFIEKVKNQLPPQRFLTIRFEDLIKETKPVKNLLAFTGSKKIKAGIIKELQKAKVNEMCIHPDEPPTMKKILDFPHYKDWQPDMRDRLKKHCAELADSYGYKLGSERQ